MERRIIEGMHGLLLGLGIPMMSFCLKLEMTGSSLIRKNYLEIMEIHTTM